MSLIEFEEVPTVKNDHFIFAEKYRPTRIEDYIGNEQFKTEIKRILSTGQLNHLMLYGSSPGTGKTTAAKLIVKNIKCDYLYINASDTNSVDDVRNKIKSFASTSGFNDLKVVICDESDFLTTAAQAALRNVIETYSLSCRFIFTCNYVEKIISPILSRCQVFEILPPSKKEVAIHLKNILDKETIKYTSQDLGYIVNTYYPDIRKILNYSQQSIIDGVIKINDENSIDADLKSKIIEQLTNRTSVSFNTIRQLVADEGVRQFEEMYQTLFDKVDEYALGKQTLAILTIAEYLYQSSLVVNKEITFMACIARLLKELK